MLAVARESATKKPIAIRLSALALEYSPLAWPKTASLDSSRRNAWTGRMPFMVSVNRTMTVATAVRERR